MEGGKERDDIPYTGPWRGGGWGVAIAGPSRAIAEGEGVGGEEGAEEGRRRVSVQPWRF